MSEEKSTIVKTKKKGRLQKKRQTLMIVLTIFLLLIAVIFTIYWFAVLQYHESTNDAYVNGHVLPITAQVGGTVTTIKVEDTQWVTAGQLLAQLDEIDTQINLQKAKANLAQTIRRTQQLFLNNEQLRAELNNRFILLQQARADLSRRLSAIRYGAVSHEDLSHARDATKSAESAWIEARSALQSNRALTEKTSLRQHPDVLFAAEGVRQAYINAGRTRIRAPVSGEISKRSVQIGQRLAPGSVLMALVPLEQVWVSANFTEKQIRHMQVGQNAILTADLYGGHVIYHGTIEGFSAGTGSAFAMLPAQNATGNWIKVIQRLPVRIQLRPEELRAHPLRIGLSMEVTIDTRHAPVKKKPHFRSVSSDQTTIYEDLEKRSDEAVAKLIEEDMKQIVSLNSANPFPRQTQKK